MFGIDVWLLFPLQAGTHELAEYDQDYLPVYIPLEVERKMISQPPSESQHPELL
jgi:hypothetical protein